MHLGSRRSMLCYNIIQENNFGQLHRDVIFIAVFKKKGNTNINKYLYLYKYYILTKTQLQICSLKLTHVPAFRSDTTDGRIHRGGTSRRVSIKSCGRPAFGFIRDTVHPK